MKKQPAKKKTKTSLKPDPEKKSIDEENYGDEGAWSEEDEPDFIDDDSIFTHDEDEEDD